MKSKFREFYNPSEDDFRALWDDGLVVLDASALLNLYRYSSSTRGELLSVLQTLRHRLWLPHQVGREFHRNRLSTISTNAASYASAEKKLEDLLDTFEKEREHPFLEPSLLERTRRLFRDIKSSLKASVERIEGSYTADQILADVTRLYEGRIGEPLADAIQQEVVREAKERAQRKIPPWLHG